MTTRAKEPHEPPAKSVQRLIPAPCSAWFSPLEVVFLIAIKVVIPKYRGLRHAGISLPMRGDAVSDLPKFIPQYRARQQAARVTLLSQSPQRWPSTSSTDSSLLVGVLQ